MKSSKKPALIVLACVAVIGIVIGLIAAFSGKNDKPAGTDKVTPKATTAPTGAVTTPEATPTGTGLENIDPTPTPVRQDYSGETIEFTNDMPDLVYSHSGNFYTTDQTIRIYSRFGGTIRYTLDGSHPTAESAAYDRSAGLLLTANAGTIPKVWSLRAAAFYDDGTKSDEFVHTYVLGAKADTRFQTMVFTINGDPAELTEGPDGILFGENYNARGRESEREIYLEVFEPDGTPVTAQKGGVRVYGAYSRQNSQKSMKFYARKTYSPETGTFYLNCLDNIAADGTGTQVVRFDKFVLRASGNDYRFAFIRDELNQTLAREAGFTEYESVCPAICYINGTYYGFFWVHASYCDTYFKNKYGDSPAKTAAREAGEEEYTEGEFVILEGGDASKKTEEGDDFNNTWAKAYDDAYYDFVYRDLTDEKNYKELCEWMVVEDYLDFMAYNIYLCNSDWPHNNYKCFRYVPAEGESLGEGVYDGRWRYLLHDIDYSLGLYSQNEVLATYDTLRRVLTEGDKRYSPLLDALLKRDDCVEYFVTKTQEFANGALSPENIRSTLNRMQSSRDREMTFYYNYIASLGAEDASWVDESQLPEQLDKILEFAQARPARSASFMKSRFALGTTYTLNIAACPNAQFVIGSYRAPAETAYTGTFFENYATTVEASVADGYAFDYWEVNGKKVSTKKLTITEADIENGAIEVVLHVKNDPNATVVIDMINGRNGDYIMLANPTDRDINVAGYTLSDGPDATFRIPDGTTIAAGATLRIECAKADSEAAANDMTCPFKLSRDDVLTLSDSRGSVIAKITIPNLHSGFVYKRDTYTHEYTEVAE